MKIIYMLKKYLKSLNLKPRWISLSICSKQYIVAPDVYENFRNKCIKIYELDPARFLSAPGLAWQACLDRSKIRIINR